MVIDFQKFKEKKDEKEKKEKERTMIEKNFFIICYYVNNYPKLTYKILEELLFYTQTYYYFIYKELLLYFKFYKTEDSIEIPTLKFCLETLENENLLECVDENIYSGLMEIKPSAYSERDLLIMDLIIDKYKNNSNIKRDIQKETCWLFANKNKEILYLIMT